MHSSLAYRNWRSTLSRRYAENLAHYATKSTLTPIQGSSTPSQSIEMGGPVILKAKVTAFLDSWPLPRTSMGTSIPCTRRTRKGNRPLSSFGNDSSGWEFRVPQASPNDIIGNLGYKNIKNTRYVESLTNRKWRWGFDSWPWNSTDYGAMRASCGESRSERERTLPMWSPHDLSMILP